MLFLNINQAAKFDSIQCIYFPSVGEWINKSVKIYFLLDFKLLCSKSLYLALNLFLLEISRIERFKREAHRNKLTPIFNIWRVFRVNKTLQFEVTCLKQLQDESLTPTLPHQELKRCLQILKVGKCLTNLTFNTFLIQVCPSHNSSSISIYSDTIFPNFSLQCQEKVNLALGNFSSRFRCSTVLLSDLC